MNKNIVMLNYIYQNAEMGETTISQILEEAKDLEFRSVLKEQLADYQKIVKKCDTLLNEQGKRPEGIDAMPKIMSYFKIKFDTLRDGTSSHIAEMLIRGSSMGVTDITKNLNRYNDDIDDGVESLAKRLLKIEENNIEALKPYL